MSEGFIQSGHGPIKTETKLTDRIDVRDFGAKGNGLDDDREAINNAIAYAAGSGQKVYFGEGTYRLFPAPWWWRAFRAIERRVRRWWWRYGR